MAKEREKSQKLHEKHQTILADMLREEDNKYCADCLAKGPRWASWNLGVFICIRCAGIHRNLGVHISRVKSVNLDSWTGEQIESISSKGNAKGKLKYEANLPPGFKRPQDDYAVETFIRSKYERKLYIGSPGTKSESPKGSSKTTPAAAAAKDVSSRSQPIKATARPHVTKEVQSRPVVAKEVQSRPPVAKEVRSQPPPKKGPVVDLLSDQPLDGQVSNGLQNSHGQPLLGGSQSSPQPGSQASHQVKDSIMSLYNNQSNVYNAQGYQVYNQQSYQQQQYLQQQQYMQQQQQQYMQQQQQMRQQQVDEVQRQMAELRVKKQNSTLNPGLW